MVDIDDTSARICPIVKMVQNESKPGMRIYRVTWTVHNYDANTNRYYTIKKERFFETEDAAKRFNAARLAAADLLGIQEGPHAGHPMALDVES